MNVEKYRYEKRSFILNSILLIILISAVAFVAVLPVTIDFWVILMIFVFFFLLIILGISPLFTYHEINREGIILRQGFYFQGRISFKNIRDIKRIFSGPRRTGVFFKITGSTLFVTSRSYDLIEVALKRPQRFGWALGKRAERVVFDTDDNVKFLNSLKGKTGLTPSSQDRLF